MPEMTLVGAINHTLDLALRNDPDVILLGEDIGLNGGVFRVTDGLQAKHGRDRVVDTPLDESGIMGSAIGLAIAGMKSVPEIQFDGFLGPAYDQLVNHAGRMRTRTRGAVTVPMTVRVPVGGGIHAPELHSDSPEAIYAHHPGIKVVMPSTPRDAKGLLLAAINDPDPVVYFEPKRVYRSFKEEVPEDLYEIEIGKAKVVNEGDDLTVVTWGAPVFQCLAAMDELPDDVSIELIDLRSIYPWDIDTVCESVRKTGRCVIVHEAPLTAGFGAEVSSRVQEECFLHLHAPVQRVTGFDTIMPFYKLELEYLPEAPRIKKGIEECLAY
ncbi:MAG: alpha-ketoacid dehydrogenase subunit beta [Phycisphaerales bacterium]|nr:alpha-ketoacid dehydrogenase subunit beta [Planctomycetota bacterium]MCH8507679.1 alpha-ketoacid dehydrogenase subunit beta [Phycisphaerales bacterium]